MFDRDHGIIISCDIDNEERLKQLIDITSSIDGIVGYKLGFTMGLRIGLRNAAEIVKDRCDLPVIYDHQKGGNDIPDMGEKFAETMKDCGIDSAILFPFTGKKTENDWINALQRRNVIPMVGGEMTHPDFFEFIKDDAPEKIYMNASLLGVNFFVVPGTKPERMREISELLPDAKLCFPGIGSQGGNLQEAFQSISGPSYAIIGSSIYKSNNIKESAQMFASIVKRFS